MKAARISVTADLVAGPVHVAPATAAALLAAEIRRMDNAIVLADQHRQAMAALEAKGLPRDAGALTRAEIVASVARAHGLTVDDLRGPSRRAPIVRARQEAMYVLALQTRAPSGSWRWSLPMIGQALGDRDHSTILHGIRHHCALHDIPYRPRDTHSSHKLRAVA